jgi:hypothetical protein
MSGEAITFRRRTNSNNGRLAVEREQHRTCDDES